MFFNLVGSGGGISVHMYTPSFVFSRILVFSFCLFVDTVDDADARSVIHEDDSGNVWRVFGVKAPLVTALSPLNRSNNSRNSTI